MQTVLRIVNDRASQLVAFGGALVNAAFAFGAPIDEAQILSLDGLLFAGVALLAGRDIARARKQEPPTS